MSGGRRLRASRNPFQLWVVIACTLTGALGLLPLRSTGVIDRVLGPTLALGWYGGLFVAGATCVIGSFLPPFTDHLKRATVRLAVERIGMYMLMGLLTGYGVAVEILAPTAPTGILLLGLAVAAGVRAAQVRRELRALRVIAHQNAEEQS